MTDMYAADGTTVVTTMDLDLLPGTVTNVLYGTRLFRRQEDGRYVEAGPGAQAVVLPVLHLPMSVEGRNKDGF